MTYERFFEYIKYPTQSDEECANCPSTGGQLVFAEYLVKELESVGAEQVCCIACHRGARKPSGHRIYCTYGYRTGIFRREYQTTHHSGL